MEGQGQLRVPKRADSGFPNGAEARIRDGNGSGGGNRNGNVNGNGNGNRNGNGNGNGISGISGISGIRGIRGISEIRRISLPQRTAPRRGWNEGRERKRNQVRNGNGMKSGREQESSSERNCDRARNGTGISKRGRWVQAGSGPIRGRDSRCVPAPHSGAGRPCDRSSLRSTPAHRWRRWLRWDARGPEARGAAVVGRSHGARHRPRRSTGGRWLLPSVGRSSPAPPTRVAAGIPEAFPAAPAVPLVRRSAGPARTVAVSRAGSPEASSPGCFAPWAIVDARPRAAP